MGRRVHDSGPPRPLARKKTHAYARRSSVFTLQPIMRTLGRSPPAARRGGAAHPQGCAARRPATSPRLGARSRCARCAAAAAGRAPPRAARTRRALGILFVRNRCLADDPLTLHGPGLRRSRRRPPTANPAFAAVRQRRPPCASSAHSNGASHPSRPPPSAARLQPCSRPCAACRRPSAAQSSSARAVSRDQRRTCHIRKVVLEVPMGGGKAPAVMSHDLAEIHDVSGAAVGRTAG